MKKILKAIEMSFCQCILRIPWTEHAEDEEVLRRNGHYKVNLDNNQIMVAEIWGAYDEEI